MVDFHDPLVIYAEYFASIKLWHTINGIFIWEFVITLEYEWSIIRRRRPYRWSIWIYSMTRICALTAVILDMVVMDTTSRINCQLWAIFELIFAYLAFASASLLIVLRIFAVWNWNKVAVAIAVCTWCTNVAFLIHGITQLKSTWAPSENVCTLPNPHSNKNNIIVAFITDVVLLLVMLIGILRLRRHSNLLGLGQLLWRQGLIWLLLATIAEVPPAVFISLNLNIALDIMLQPPALIIMSIAATRMHRSFQEFVTNEFSEPKQTSIAPIPLNLEVSVHRPYEAYAPGQHGTYRSYHNMDSPPPSPAQDKSFAPGIDKDPENGVNKAS